MCHWGKDGQDVLEVDCGMLDSGGSNNLSMLSGDLGRTVVLYALCPGRIKRTPCTLKRVPVGMIMYGHFHGPSGSRA